MTTQYCVFTSSPEFIEVLDWLDKNEIKCEVHLNRTRFWIPDGELKMMFLLKWSHCCPIVHDNEDLVTGIRL
jgi:hypothetical protein